MTSFIPTLISTYFVLAIGSALSVLIVFVPWSRWHAYGKLREDSANHHGTILDRVVVPKHWFRFFYVLGFIWNAIFLLVNPQDAIHTANLLCTIFIPKHLLDIVELTCDTTTPSSFNTNVVMSSSSNHTGLFNETKFALLLFQVHLFRRMMEEVGGRALTTSSNATMHVTGFLIGVSFYVMSPLTFALAPIFGYDACPPLENAWLRLSLKTIFAAMFLWGSIHQERCHRILRELRFGAATTTPTTPRPYSIPHGDWFEFSSSPHYLAELVIYVGLIGAAMSSNGGCFVFPQHLLMFGFCTINLCVTGGKTHAWYLTTFPEYAALGRWKVVPYVY